MANEYPSVDISHDPEVSKLAEEVRTTNRSHILKRADEDIAVIAPVRTAAKRQPDKGAAVSGIPHYTLGQVLGSVPTPPHLHGKDIDEMIREAKEERGQRTMLFTTRALVHHTWQTYGAARWLTTARSPKTNGTNWLPCKSLIPGNP